MSINLIGVLMITSLLVSFHSILDFRKRKRQFSCGTDLWSISVDIGFGIQLRKIQALFLVKSVKLACKIVFSAFESRSKRRPPSLPWLGGLGGDTRGSWHRRQSKILEKHLCHAKVSVLRSGRKKSFTKPSLLQSRGQVSVGFN